VPAIFDDFRRKHSPMLLAVGGLEKDYDPLFQIAAMKDIIAEFPSAGLMIVGDGSMRAEVEQAVSASGHAGAIMIAGNVEHAVTLHLIDAADVLLRTTLFDGDAISVREAIYLGTPVIATDNGMRPEGVHVIAIGDRKALIENVMEAVTGGKQERALSPPDEKNIEKIIELYKDIARPSLS
ncbi:MAG: glycosyltransferase, partial [Pyrinomonadaceae bacterium]